MDIWDSHLTLLTLKENLSQELGESKEYLLGL